MSNLIDRGFTLEWSSPPGIESSWGCIRLTVNQSIKVPYNDYEAEPYGGLNVSELSGLPRVFPGDDLFMPVDKVRFRFAPVLYEILEDIDQIESSIRCEAERITNVSKLTGMVEEADFAEYCLRYIDETMAPLDELRSVFSRQVMALDWGNVARRGKMILNGAKDAICGSMQAFHINPSAETFNAAITWVTELPYIIRRSISKVLEEEKNLWLRCYWGKNTITRGQATLALPESDGFAA